MNNEILYPVVEIYPAFQGEGIEAGQPTIFVRMGGCDYHCKWCDSLHAVIKKKYGHTWIKLTNEEILAFLQMYTFKHVTLSGGNPLIHDIRPLVGFLKTNGYYVSIETQGTLNGCFTNDIDTICVSPKPPSSGHVTDIEKFNEFLSTINLNKTFIKVVVFDEDDFNFAKEVYNNLETDNLKNSFYLSIGHVLNEVKDDYIERIGLVHSFVEKEISFHPKVLPQIHVLQYGDKQKV